MNCIQEIAKMLGVEIGESFRFKSNEIDLSKYEYRLTEKQLEYYCEEFNVWYAATFKTICNLLNGEYEVVKLSKPILSENEKDYLAGVIKPFRNEVKYVVKDCDEFGPYISISVQNGPSITISIQCFLVKPATCFL